MKQDSPGRATGIIFIITVPALQGYQNIYIIQIIEFFPDRGIYPLIRCNEISNGFKLHSDIHLKDQKSRICLKKNATEAWLF